MSELNLRELRQGKGMTLNELATIMGVSIQTIRNWESGKKIPSTAMAKLRQVFNLEGGDGSNVASNINGDINQNSGLVIEALIKQLEIKDNQIDKLLRIIEKLNK